MPLPQRKLGDRLVSAIGYGAMHLSTEARPERSQAIRTLHAALDAGATLIDTADVYCPSPAETGHNERLVAEALRSWPGPRSAVLVATKGGHVRTPGGGWDVDGRPAALRAACEASLRALGVESIGLYQFHRPDPSVPLAESFGELARLQERGLVQMVGASNLNVEQIMAASAIVPLVSVQNQFSPDFTSSIGELRHCARAGIAFLSWGPLGQGGVARLGERHPAFAAVAARHGVSPQQVALAWALHLAEVVIPIPGAKREASVTDSLGAAALQLSAEDLGQLPAPG